VLPGLLDGVTYFHIRAIDGAGNFSRTIHYKVQVSANPLPMPVVVSPTHPQGKKGPATAPVLKWAVDDRERLKGFVYSISKDSATYPRKFTTDFEKTFRDLKEGAYFFSISAIDRTNQKSQIADYYFLVGEAKGLDSDDLRDRWKNRVPEKIRYIARKPKVEIDFPFDTAGVLDKSSFNAVMGMKHVKKKAVTGYAVAIDKKPVEAPKRLTTNDTILRVDKLTSGTWHLSVRGQYYRYKKGKKELAWTKPVAVKFRVEVPDTLSPVLRYGRQLIERIGHDYIAVSSAVGILSLLVMVIGFGTKSVFYLRLAAYRLRVLLKL